MAMTTELDGLSRQHEGLCRLPFLGKYRSGQRGHYFFTVKDNQPTLKQDIKDIWESEAPAQAVQTNKHGGRVERRLLWVSGLLAGYSDWPHLAQVCRLERTTHEKKGIRRELAYAVTSLSACPFWVCRCI